MKLQMAEAALREKTAYLDSILRSSFDMAILATDLDFHITYFNPAAETIYGYAFDQVSGKPLSTLYNEENLNEDHIKLAIKRVNKQERLRYVAKKNIKGETRLLECQVSGIRDTENILIGYVLMSVDVTTQISAEVERTNHLHYLTNIDRINQILQSTSSIPHLTKGFVEAMRNIFGCDRAWILSPCDPQAESWHITVESNHPDYPGAFASQQDYPVDDQVAEAFKLALDTKQAVVYDSTTKRPIPEGERFSIKSQITLAIQPRLGEPWLLGMHQCSSKRIWTAEEQRLLQDIGSRLTDGISNLLFYQRLESTHREWEESFNAVHDHIVICDTSGTILRANETTREYFKDSHPNLIGLCYKLVYFGEDNYDQPCSCSLAIKSGAPVDMEIQFPTMGGWQQVSIYPRFNSEDKQVGMVMVVRDITENKLNATKLQRSKKRYQTLVDTMTEGLGVQDENDNIQYVNGRLCDMLGYSSEEMIGRHIADFVATEDQAVFEKYLGKRRQGKASPYEMRLIHRSGSKVHLYISPQIIQDEEGRFGGSFAVFTDLTERKRSENELRKLSQAVQQSPNSIIITDSKGIIEYTNPSFTRITGYSMEEAIGNRPSLIKSGQTPGTLYKELWDTIRSGKIWEGEIKNKKKDGTLYLDQVAISPIIDHKGNITHFVGIQTDITKRRQAEEQVELHQSKLAHVSRINTLGEMASGLAHELNQPLTAITNYGEVGLEMLQSSEIQPSKAIHALKQTLNQARRAGEIIQRIRRMVKNEKHHRDAADINALIKDVVALSKVELSRHTIQLNLELDPVLPRINVDSIQIEQVILNLVRNAIEAMEPGGVLTIHSQVADDGQVKITVEDAGHGFSEAGMDHLFTPFHSTKPGGLGVGLSLSQSIIESHGGRLWAEPRNPQGALFHFTLPQNEQEKTN